MAYTDPVQPSGDSSPVQAPLESYSTFWNAVPVDPAPATAPVLPEGDAYVAFMDLTEEGPPPAQLHVERC